MDGQVTHRDEECYICGKTIPKGVRAFRARPLRSATDKGVVYPTFAGGIRISQAFRHRECRTT